MISINLYIRIVQNENFNIVFLTIHASENALKYDIFAGENTLLVTDNILKCITQLYYFSSALAAATEIRLATGKVETGDNICFGCWCARVSMCVCIRLYFNGYL